jgi:hypothetical protein
MKYIFSICMAVLAAAAPLSAQLAVNDAGSQALLAKGNADYIEKTISTFQKMDAQIQKLEDSLRQAQRMVQVMGDPQQALQQIGGLGELPGVLGEADDLFRLGREISETADGARSLFDTGEGLYQSIPTSLPDGTAILRDVTRYKPFAAFEAEEENFSLSLERAQSQRRKLLTELQTTIAQPVATDAEERAKQSKILALDASLSAIDAQVRDANDQRQSRAEANENDRAKQEQAQREAVSELERQSIEQAGNPGFRH